MRESLTTRVMEAVEHRLRSRVPVRTLRVVYRVGYLLLRPWWFVTRPRTLGVKVVVRCGDDVLLVRHSYARRHEWDLPGGFLRPGEDPERALRRELAEELQIAPTAVMPIAILPARHDHKRERLIAYVADVATTAVVPSEAEIADVCWVRHDALPHTANRLTRRMAARAYWELWEDPQERVVARDLTQR